MYTFLVEIIEGPTCVTPPPIFIVQFCSLYKWTLKNKIVHVLFRVKRKSSISIIFSKSYSSNTFSSFHAVGEIRL